MPSADQKQKTSTLSEQDEVRPMQTNLKKEVEKVLFSWTAAARPFKRRTREFYVTIITIAIIVGLILFLTEGFMPVVLLISLIFLFYILNTVEPERIEYKITNQGLKIADKKTEWELLNRFWFTKRYDSELLILGMNVVPGRMELVVNSSDKETLRKTISRYLSEEEIPPSFLDKAANWFAKKLPGSN